MHTPTREAHTPDPKCCCCGLRPRRTSGNDVLRLIAVVLLLLPVIFMLWGCPAQTGPEASGSRTGRLTTGSR